MSIAQGVLVLLYVTALALYLAYMLLYRSRDCFLGFLCY
jgi:hypothetical protein